MGRLAVTWIDVKALAYSAASMPSAARMDAKVSVAYLQVGGTR